jgi:hypothetical protein
MQLMLHVRLDWLDKVENLRSLLPILGLTNLGDPPWWKRHQVTRTLAVNFNTVLNRQHSRREGRSGVNAQVGVCPVVGQQQMREKEWGINTRPQNLAITMQNRDPRYFWPQVSTTEGCQEIKQWSFIGTTDPGSVLPRVWLKFAREPISVLPTKAETSRKEEQMCSCWLGVPLTNLGHLLKHF